MAKLGDFHFEKKSFKDLDEVFKRFYQDDFKKLGDRQRSDLINQTLLELIQKEDEPCFLLSAVLNFVERIDEEDVLHHYILTSFELWLNQISGLSYAENLRIRAKIIGKYIPREEYQSLFPIGMGKSYPGSHFVTAHRAPDLDTTIASFWGWIDSFGARVGESLHIWNLPGGPPASQIEIDLIFRDIFGKAIFTHVPKTRNVLSLTGNDLMRRDEMVVKKTSDKTAPFHQNRLEQAVVITDDAGYYLGDWRSMDVESVRGVIMLLNQCLRWFENHLHINLIELFSKKDLTFDAIPEFVKTMFGKKIDGCEPTKEFNEMEKKRLHTLLSTVFDVKEGLNASFYELGSALSSKSIVDFERVIGIQEKIRQGGLFDESGKLVEDRPLIFSSLAKIISGLHKGIQSVRNYTEALDVVIKVKTKVFGLSPKFVTVRADVEEIRSKMGTYQYLTVAYPDQDRFFPVGVISATDIRNSVLGTVSLRDFSNRNEMAIPSYLEVISVIDHHKMELSTYQPPLAIISDAQSSNAIVAEQAFLINDRHTFSGMEKSAIDAQMKEEMKSGESHRKITTLLQYQKAANQQNGYYIHPEREMIEYIHFLYGILDDTDLLSKVSYLDVEVIMQLLNRLKTLSTGTVTEIINLDDIPKDEHYARAAAVRILQNEDMYSLYKKVYSHREEVMEVNLAAGAEGKPSTIFSDVKEQNKIVRISQTKMFSNNIAIFEKNKDKIRDVWCKKAEAAYKENPDLDLHLHMTSTVIGAEDVFKGGEVNYHHKDEMWIWVPESEVAIEHLKLFLSAFQTCPQILDNEIEIELLGDNADDLELVFKESFLPIKCRKENKGLPIAVLYYKAGSINSRKAMITPYLPQINH